MTYTKWRDDSDLDRNRFGWIMVSTYGEAFVALNTISNERVVVKKMKLVPDKKAVERMRQLLKEYQSSFLVKYHDVLKRDKELWVRYGVYYVMRVDSDGVLSLWFIGRISKERESIE